jgi:FkbM family methyltransferase
MKRLVKSVLAKRGYRIENMRYVPRQLRDSRSVRSVEFDDLVCRRMFEAGTALTFIQIGAFDGETKDPIRQYIQRCARRGIMVEPQRSAVAKLRRLYDGNSGIEIIEAAIDRQHGTRTLFTVDGPGAPDWSGCLASFNRDNIVKHKALIPKLEEMISAVQVETMTFDTILARLPGQEIDILQLDTEGADAMILSLFPFEQVRPVIVHWEVKHLTTTEQEATLERLFQYGYRFAPSGGEDMLASRI